MTVVVVRGGARRLPLPDGSVDLICTSPPYFALRDYRDGDASLAGQIGSEATPTAYIAALVECTREWMRVLKPGGSMFVDLGDKYSGSPSGPPGASTQVSDTQQERLRVNGRRRVANAVPSKSLMLLPERYRIACVDQLGLIARSVIIWNKPNGLPESVTDRVRRSHEDWVHLTKAPRYYAAVDEIREPHIRPLTAEQMRRNSQGPNNSMIHGTSRGRARGDVPPSEGGEFTGSNPLGKLPGSVWEIATEPLKVPDRLAVDHFAAFPSEWPRRLVLGWSPPGVCTACDEGRRPVVTSVALNMDRPQARRAHELAERAGLTEAHFEALLSVGVSDTGRGAATQTGTGKNTPEVYALADEARGVLGGYAREYLLRRPTGFGYACACTPYTDHPGTGGDSGRHGGRGNHDEQGYPNKGMAGQWGGTDLGSRPKVGPWREYHFDRWTPAPTRPAVVLDPFGGTGTTAHVAAALGRIGVTVDLSGGYSSKLAASPELYDRRRRKVLGLDKPVVDPVPEGQLAFDGWPA